MRVTTIALIVLPLTIAHLRPLERSHRPARAVDGTRVDERGLWPDNLRPRAGETKDDGLLGGLLGEGSSTSSSSSVAPTSTKSTLSSSTTSSTLSSSTTSTESTTSKLSVSPSVDPSASASHSASLNGTVALNTTSTTSSSSVAPSSAPPTSSSQPSVQSTSQATEYTTDAAGKTVILTLTQTLSNAESAAAASTSGADKSDGDSISKPAIIGISVAVGVVVLALVLCAVYRMKRRTTDDDEVIRWPELNRHGDSDAHHALPARQTGQHGIETSPLERSISNSSSIFTPSAAAHSAAPMALNGSSFGAGPSLENYAHEQSPSSGHSDSPDLRPMSGYENDDAYDYSSFPPPVQMHVQPSGAGGAYDSDEEGHSPMSSQEGRMVMSQLPGPGHVTYGTH